MAGTIDAEGQMVLDSPGSTQFERWSWLKEGARVRQVARFTQDGGITFAAPHFDGLYTRR
jgi:hypothetical protein